MQTTPTDVLGAVGDAHILPEGGHVQSLEDLQHTQWGGRDQPRLPGAEMAWERESEGEREREREREREGEREGERERGRKGRWQERGEGGKKPQ